MGLTAEATETDHGILITGGNDRILSVWDADGEQHTAGASSTRSNGMILDGVLRTR